MFCTVSIKGVTENFSLACEASVPERRAFLHSSRARKLEREKKMDLYLAGIISGIHSPYFEGTSLNATVNSANPNILHKHLTVKTYWFKTIIFKLSKGCCTKYFSSVLGVTRHLLFCCLLRTFWNDVLIIKNQSVVTRVCILVDFMLTFIGIK